MNRTNKEKWESTLRLIEEDKRRIKFKIKENELEIERLRKIDNDILDAIEDRAVDQQINIMRGK